MRSLLSRIATGLAPAAVMAMAVSLFGAVSATPAEAKERPRGDWHRYCKDVDIRGDWLEADCRKYGGGWRRNTRINFDNCPGNEVTVHDGRLVCQRHQHYGWDRDRWDDRRWDDRRYGWNGKNWDKNWDRHERDRRDWDRGRDGKDKNWSHRHPHDNGPRYAERHDNRRDRKDWNKDRRRDDQRQQVNRRDDRRRDRDNERDEWWKRGNS